MRIFNKKTKLLAALLCLSFTFSNTVVAASPVVEGYGIHYGGKVQYHYRVTNYDTDPLSMVWVGHDTLNDNDPYSDKYELLEDPSNMFAGKQFPSSDYFDIPTASVSYPAGGGVERIQPEETVEHSLKWRLAPPVMPGQVQGGMSVTLDKPDMTHLACHVTLGFWNRYGDKGMTTVLLQRQDVIAPTLSIVLTPAQQVENDKLVPVTAAITVKDDYDPQPEIKLESITANDVLEAGDIQGAQYGQDVRQFSLKADIEQKNIPSRIYTVTYSATDGSGNKSTATATFTVLREAH